MQSYYSNFHHVCGGIVEELWLQMMSSTLSILIPPAFATMQSIMCHQQCKVCVKPVVHGAYTAYMQLTLYFSQYDRDCVQINWLCQMFPKLALQECMHMYLKECLVLLMLQDRLDEDLNMAVQLFCLGKAQLRVVVFEPPVQCICGYLLLHQDRGSGVEGMSEGLDPASAKFA